METLVEYTKDALVRLGIKGGHAVKLIAHANKTTGREEANANAVSQSVSDRASPMLVLCSPSAVSQ